MERPGEENAVRRVTGHGWAGAFVKDLDFALMRRHSGKDPELFQLSELFQICTFTSMFGLPRWLSSRESAWGHRFDP